jgi:hypothetical protein
MINCCSTEGLHSPANLLQHRVGSFKAGEVFLDGTNDPLLLGKRCDWQIDPIFDAFRLGCAMPAFPASA